MTIPKVLTSAFPLYLLRLNGEWKIILPEDRTDIGHTDFWEQTVSHIVAEQYRIPQKQLANLPYCERRARVVGDTIYYGERPDPKLLRSIRQTVGNHKLAFCHDDHEKRLREDVQQLRKLVRRFCSNPLI
jgi:hypothetical protein